MAKTLITPQTAAAQSDSLDINIDNKPVTPAAFAQGNYPQGTTFRVTGGALGAGEYVTLKYADIQLAVVRVLPAGFAWVYENGKWGIDKGEMHQVVVWDDMVLDNRFDRVVVREDLNREYGW